MFLKIIPLAVRNMFRSKTRMVTTVAGCAVGAFVIGLFLTAGHSLDLAMENTRNSANLIVTQQDRY